MGTLNELKRKTDRPTKGQPDAGGAGVAAAYTFSDAAAAAYS